METSLIRIHGHTHKAWNFNNNHTTTMHIISNNSPSSSSSSNTTAVGLRDRVPPAATVTIKKCRSRYKNHPQRPVVGTSIHGVLPYWCSNSNSIVVRCPSSSSNLHHRLLWPVLRLYHPPLALRLRLRRLSILADALPSHQSPPASPTSPFVLTCLSTPNYRCRSVYVRYLAWAISALHHPRMDWARWHPRMDRMCHWPLCTRPKV